jgi:hypothetical protein
MYTEGGTLAKVVQEYGAEEDICAWEGHSNKEVEKPT